MNDFNEFKMSINHRKRKEKLNDIFMSTAIKFASMSTCIRKQVGAVIVKNGRIISTGFNGTPPGVIHCEDYFLGKNEITAEEHHDFSIRYELHAEANAILECLNNEISPRGGSLYTTISPCVHCAKMILSVGIKNVYYLEEYDRENESGIKLLKENKVSVYQMNFLI